MMWFYIQLVLVVLIVTVGLCTAIWRLSADGVEVAIMLPIIRIRVGSVAGGGGQMPEVGDQRSATVNPKLETRNSEPKGPRHDPAV